jgi:RNA polymerase sigma factor (sigma-70 family)
VYQKVLIRLWKKAPASVSYKYLAKLVKNTYIDDYRMNKKHLNHTSIDCIDYSSVYGADQSVVKKESDIVRNLQLHELLEKINNLKEGQQDVILLRIAGYSFVEIAKIMNTSINTALGQLHYAKQHLKKRKSIN